MNTPEQCVATVTWKFCYQINVAADQMTLICVVLRDVDELCSLYILFGEACSDASHVQICVFVKFRATFKSDLRFQII